MTSSLVGERRRPEVPIACVNRWAARQQRVCNRWASAILQRTKQRIGIDLIAWTGQITAAAIAAEVILNRRDAVAVVEDVFARCAGIQDCVSHDQRRGVIGAATLVPELPLMAVFSRLSRLSPCEGERMKVKGCGG